jgi:FtsH-binding integral membrane protein
MSDLVIQWCGYALVVFVAISGLSAIRAVEGHPLGSQWLRGTLILTVALVVVLFLGTDGNGCAPRWPGD